MRILMLNNEFPPLGGGMGTVNQALFHQFVLHKDMEIDLITSALGGHREKEQFSERIWIYKVPVWNRNIHHSSNRELVFYAIQAFWVANYLNRKKDYDFCFAWSGLPAGAVALALYRLDKLPYVIRVSGPDIPGFERRYQRLYPLLMPVIRAVWRSARPLIAKCQHEAEMIHAIDPEVPVAILPNGADLQGFSPGKSLSVEGTLKVICVARLIERKGQQYLIQAAKQLLNEGIEVEIILVGTGDSMEDYRKLARDLNVLDRVRFEGYIPRDKIASCYQDAHVFALPSFNEGMSLAMLEAMASGLPLVVTRTGGNDCLAKDGLNGYTFTWGDVDQLACNLKKLSQDRLLLQQMGFESRRRVEKFSWQGIVRQYVDLFATVGSGVGE